MPRTGTIQRTGTFPRTDTMLTYRSQRTKHRGFGGFPMPHEIISRLINWWFPDFKRNLTRTVTIPRTQTITSQNAVNLVPGARPVSYITFEAIVGRNSNFQELTREELDELGGVEYRGLSALLWIVGGVSFHSIRSSIRTHILFSIILELNSSRSSSLRPTSPRKGGIKTLSRPPCTNMFLLFGV